MIFWAEFILMHKANSLVFEHLTIDFFMKISLQFKSLQIY